MADAIGFSMDVSTLLLLPGQEILNGSALTDVTGLEGTITAVGSPVANAAGPATGLSARTVDASGAGRYFSKTAASAATATSEIQGDATLEFVFAPSASFATGVHTLFALANGVTKWLWLIYNEGALQILWNATGNVEKFASEIYALTAGAWYYVAIRKTLTSGSGATALNTVEIFIRPLIDPWSATPDHIELALLGPFPSGSSPRYTVGAYFQGTHAFLAASFGFGGLRLSSIARSNAELEASFDGFHEPSPVFITVSPGTAPSGAAPQVVAPAPDAIDHAALLEARLAQFLKT